VSTRTQRILVFGNSGSGKSRFARRAAATHGLPVLDLDVVVWSDAGVFRPDAEIAATLAGFVQGHDSWVVEGCYGRWVEYLLPRCTELVFMNPGEAVCRSNCLSRPWEPHKYASRQEQDAALTFLLEWVRGYYTREDDMSLQAHRRIYDAFGGSRREVTENQPS
jgi:adenylate kinase family enzyme